MPRKKKHDRSKRPPRRSQGSQGPPRTPLFGVGSRVRVRRGVPDPNYPDVPLGGWVGTIEEIEAAPRTVTYLVAWDRPTLEMAHPVFHHRCDRDGYDPSSMWLSEEDLEADPGDPIVLEQPTALTPRPLRPQDPEDQVRVVFGLTSDDPLPPVTPATLRRYHAHLSQQLSFPFAAIGWEPVGPFQERVHKVRVLRLIPAEELGNAGELLAEVAEGEETIVVSLRELEVRQPAPHRKALLAYDCWLDLAPEADEEDDEPVLEEGDTESAPRLLLFLLSVVAVVGAVTGGILAGVENAPSWIEIGAIVCAALGGLMGIACHGWLIPRQSLLSSLVNASAGAALGGSLGAFVAALLVTYLGSVPGSIVGMLVYRWLVRNPDSNPFYWAVLGAGVGGVALAVYQSGWTALLGAGCGLVLGPLAAALILASSAFLYSVFFLEEK